MSPELSAAPALDAALTPVASPPLTVPAPAAPLPAAPAGDASLTRRALLTAVASMLDYGAQTLVTLLVTPIVVARLGSSLYGVWEMLRQAVGYMSATDGRAMDALRLTVATQQANPDPVQLRRHVGAAMRVWLVFLPLAAIAGTALVWLAPTITKVGPDRVLAVRMACAFLVLAFVVAALAAIPEAVLRGMNLGYKRMGWQTSLSVAGGALMAGAAYAGFEVMGLGAAQLALALLTGIVFLLLVRHCVPGFGIARPERKEVSELLRMSAWLTGGLVLTNLLLATDVIILGMVVSSAVVATYVLTGAATRMTVTLFNFTVGATTPGIGGLLGEKKFDRLVQVRRDLLSLTWLFTTVVGGLVLLCNRSFVALWVGAEHFAGTWANVLIVCVMVQTAFIRGDAFVIDASLRPRPRVIVTAVAAATTIGATLALTPRFGIIGLCVGLLVGRLPQTVAFPILVSGCLAHPRRLPLWETARRGVVMVAVFGAAAWAGERLQARHWIEFAGLGAAGGSALVLVALWGGLSAAPRRSILGRLRSAGRSVRG